MAGDWIKFEIATSDKPEVWAIAESLKIDADAVVGKLLRIWSWFDQQTAEGNAVGNGASVTSSVTIALLNRRVSVSGFCEAMIEVGWMLDDGQNLTLPKFDRHNGKTAKSRALTAKRVATHKAKSNADSVTSSVSGALPREEKRREDINTPLPPNGESVVSEEKPEQPQADKPLRRTRKTQETIGKFQIPKRLDTPEVRKALEDFETMRLRTGKRIRDRGNVCRGWDARFVDVAHLLACIDITIANEWQGIDPKYVTAGQASAVKKPSLWDTVKKY